MSDSEKKEQDTKTPERKKVSLQEAMKQMLETKKQGKSAGKPGYNSTMPNTGKKTQFTQKPNNQRRKTGGA